MSNTIRLQGGLMPLLGLLFGVGSMLGFGSLAEAEPVRITVHHRPQHTISPLLFGQFMEDADAREPGPESPGALIPGTGTFRPEVIDKLRELRATIIRFPGGFMAERHNARFDYRLWLPGPIPGWSEPEPTGERRTFGLLEFFAACEELGTEKLLVVPCRVAYQGQRKDTRPGRTIEQTAAFAAGLVAFANVALPDDVEPSLRPWVELRHAAGRPEPAGVKYWQIGNEWFLFRKQYIGPNGWSEKAFNDRHVEIVDAVSRAMRAVDPSIVLITDAVTPDLNQRILALEPGVDLIADHSYSPHALPAEAKRDGRQVPISSMTAEEHWRMLATMPYCNPQGQSFWRTDRRGHDEHDAPLAFTEWNWNGWGKGVFGHPDIEPAWAMGVGVGGFMHAILRAGDRALLATQSMMVGSKWGITGVRVSPDHPPFLTTKGRVFAFYAEHHGDRFLSIDDSAVPTYTQPYRIGPYVRPERVVRQLDAVATADDRRVYVHLVHRSYDQPMDLTIDLSGLLPDASSSPPLAELRLLLGRSDVDLDDPALADQLIERTDSIEIKDGLATFRLPAQAVGVLILDRS